MPSPEGAANIRGIEEALIKLDPIFRDFCSRYGFSLRHGPELYPKRILWHRSEIDRVLDLSPELTVAEIIEKGFAPDMPWSLYASASVLPKVRTPPRILTLPVFQRVSCSQLEAAMAASLEEGYALLRALTYEDVILRGQEHRHIT